MSDSLRRRTASFKPEGPALPASPATSPALKAAAPPPPPSDDDEDVGGSRARAVAPADAAARRDAEAEGDWLAIHVLLGFVIAFMLGAFAPSVFPVSGRAIAAAGLGVTLLGFAATIFSPGGLSAWMLQSVFCASGGLGLVVGGLVGSTVSLAL
jgi:hypothetical protein